MTPAIAEPVQASTPFQFATASYLTRVENFQAQTIGELAEGIAQASDASIFYHTFQTLGRHHFLTEGFSNDFAQWVLAGLNQPALAERLASIDVRDYLSIAELRADLRRILTEFQAGRRGESQLRAFEPFYFCQAVEVTQPLPWDAKTLPGFRAGLERLSHASFYYHFIASRLRLQLRTNDFSNWFENALGLKELADKTNRIDIYTNTLDSARREMSELIDREIGR
ncbi:MAG TPA: DUF5752 family protein [Bryobacteraceae bacterium]|nr:DUF5752 family protein [Bryobacteraceae bacterium]